MKIGPKRDWTVLVYNAGSSNAAMSCTHNLQELERVGSDEHTQVVCMNGRNAWVPERLGLWRDYEGARTYALGPGTGRLASSELGKAFSFLKTSPAALRSPVIEEQPDANMSDPATLRQFLLDNLARYPSRHVAVVIAGHGAGFAGQASTPQGRIGNEALAEVLRDVTRTTGQKIDLVDFNNCYGASLEVMHPLRGAVDCAVGSQSVQFGPTQPLGEVLRRLQEELKAGREVSGAELGRIFVDAAREQPLASLSTPTLSAVDPSRLAPVAERLGALHRLLMAQGVPPERIREWLAQSERVEYASVPRSIYNYDLVSFAGVVARESELPQVREAARAVGEAVQASVLAEQHAEPGGGLIGWGLRTIFQPDPTGQPSGLSLHYDDQVNARGNRLDQLKDTALGRELAIEPFLHYLSQG